MNLCTQNLQQHVALQAQNLSGNSIRFPTTGRITLMGLERDNIYDGVPPSYLHVQWH